MDLMGIQTGAQLYHPMSLMALACPALLKMDILALSLNTDSRQKAAPIQLYTGPINNGSHCRTMVKIIYIYTAYKSLLLNQKINIVYKCPICTLLLSTAYLYSQTSFSSSSKAASLGAINGAVLTTLSSLSSLTTLSPRLVIRGSNYSQQ